MAPGTFLGSKIEITDRGYTGGDQATNRRRPGPGRESRFAPPTDSLRPDSGGAGTVFGAGDLVAVEPGEVADYEVLEDAVTVIVKVPGARDDKHPA